MSKLVMPNYQKCVLNTITSILKFYNVQTNHASLPSLDEILKRRYRNVVLIILDGMGECLLKSISPIGFFAKN